MACDHTQIPYIILKLDLEPIMVKIMDPEEGKGWSLEYTQKIANEYRKYLTLCLNNRNTPVPAKDVDEFWHYHILDTLKYHQDCNEIFGEYLHHFPYYGMRGQKDKENLQQAWSKTCQQYKQLFGEIDKDIWSASARCPNCGRRSPFGNEEMMECRPRLTVALG